MFREVIFTRLLTSALSIYCPFEIVPPGAVRKDTPLFFTFRRDEHHDAFTL